MKICITCGKRVRSDLKVESCKQCLAVCKCGAFKDWRASQCRSCASKIQTKKQWAKIRDKMMDSLIVAGVRRRRKYEDLQLSDFREIKPDGRRFARYTDDSGRLRTIYEYQWIWETAHGQRIPSGHVIHHIDHNSSNNAVENLQLMTFRDHAVHHHSGQETTGWICQICGETFIRAERGKGNPRYFCSRKCKGQYSQAHGRVTCKTFQKVRVKRE
jgi:hypothetical protein